ncbi:MAG: precorrin-6y C5,15-methyltransferase (decarboxylating) subunit CbiE [Ruminococcus sp.]|nr:precorrin-6y C5,15-methyltransferase (decarboxylating) subunit CbiE [Ruminococcus sp.]
MKVYIVGAGADGEKGLTVQGRSAIGEAGLLIGSKRLVERFEDMGKEIYVTYKPEDIAKRLKNSSADCAAVLMSGDCGFYSGAKALLPMLTGHEVKVIGGVSSMVYMCSELGLDYENMKAISLHGRKGYAAINVKLHEKCFFLLGGEIGADELCRHLCSHGLGNVTVYIGADLGYEEQRIISGRADELRECRVSKLCSVITVNPGYLRHIPACIDDGQFIRDKVPMTKAEVRCAAVAMLNIGRDSVCWDIGSGTGAVSVEMAYRCPQGEVYAFDKAPEAAALTEKNAGRFACDNIICKQGECPEMLRNVPAPQKVFIGGTSGNMEAIFAAVHHKNPRADVAVTAVSLETLEEARQCFGYYGVNCSVTQIAVTRTKTVGEHTMFDAQNPVFIIRGRLR